MTVWRASFLVITRRNTRERPAGACRTRLGYGDALLLPSSWGRRAGGGFRYQTVRNYEILPILG